MRKLGWIVTLAAFAALSTPAAADTAVPELRGTWKGDSQSIVLGAGPHHPDAKTSEPRLTSVPFTLAIDMQDGRRFSGKFSSSQHSEAVVAVVSRGGTIFMADDDGHIAGTMLAGSHGALLPAFVIGETYCVMHGADEAEAVGLAHHAYRSTPLPA